MEINLHNYEAFFLDHKEGNLDAQQERELFAFLEAHPELKAELESFEDLVLEPEDLFEQKAFLKKPEFDEETLIAYTEGLSDARTESEIRQLAAENLDLKKEIALYEIAKLSPDMSLKYPGRSKLKHGGVVIYLQSNPIYLRAAAALLLLVGLFFLVSRVISDQPVQKRGGDIANNDKRNEVVVPVKEIKKNNADENKIAPAMAAVSSSNNNIASKSKDQKANLDKQHKNADEPGLVKQVNVAVNTNTLSPLLNNKAEGADTLIASNTYAPKSVNTATNTATYKAWYNYEVDTEKDNDETPPVTASASPAKRTFFQKITDAAKKANGMGVKRVDGQEEKAKSSLVIGGLVVTETVSN